MEVNNYCETCLEKWRRLTPPLEAGDAFLGILRQRVQISDLKNSLKEELLHETQDECHTMQGEHSEAGKCVAQLRLFGSSYLSLNNDIRIATTSAESSLVTPTMLRLFPSIVGPLPCDGHGLTQATGLLHEGARAVSFNLSNATDSTNDDQDVEQTLQRALREWDIFDAILLPCIPRERLQIEIDLSKTHSFEASHMENVSTAFSCLTAKIRAKVRSVLLILPSQLCQPAFVESLAKMNNDCNSKELSTPLCLVLDVPNGHSRKLIPPLVPIENVMLQGHCQVDDDLVNHVNLQNGVNGDTMSDCIWDCISCRLGPSRSLCPTVVTDSTGVALGLVYSTRETLKEAIRLKMGVYHSRKRGLWQKGQTSGHFQRLRRIDLDCDRDCLRFCVDQMSPGIERDELFTSSGRFCHRGCRTDWGGHSGIRKLSDTLEARRRSPVEGSYTNRLFNDTELLRHKLVEEAQELAEADETEDIASEAADVLYFVMVRCAARGVSIEDIERHLDDKALKIHRRPGNAKEYRMQKGEEILLMKKDTK